MQEVIASALTVPRASRTQILHVCDSTKTYLPRHLKPTHIKHVYEGALARACCATLLRDAEWLQDQGHASINAERNEGFGRAGGEWGCFIICKEPNSSPAEPALARLPHHPSGCTQT